MGPHSTATLSPPVAPPGPTNVCHSVPIRLAPVDGPVHATFQSKYALKERRGAGASGEVWIARRIADGVEFAAKIVKLTQRMNTTQRNYAMNESRWMSMCRSPFVVGVVDSWCDSDCVVTVMELVRGVDLADHMRPPRPEKSAPVETRCEPSGSSTVAGRPPSSRRRMFTESAASLIAAQLLLALYDIHRRGVVHRDLKSRNVFLCDSGLLKVGDFGLSCAVTNPHSSGEDCCSVRPVRRTDHYLHDAAVGTPCYMAPELWSTVSPPYSPASDIWSVGVILHELLAQRLPFNGASDEDLGASIRRGDIDIQRAAPNASEEMCCLVRRMLSPRAADRPTAFEALQSKPMRGALSDLLKLLKSSPLVLPHVAAAAMRSVGRVTESTGDHPLTFRTLPTAPILATPVEKWCEQKGHVPGKWKRRMLILTSSCLEIGLMEGIAAAAGSRASLQLPLSCFRGVLVPSIDARPTEQPTGVSDCSWHYFDVAHEHSGRAAAEPSVYKFAVPDAAMHHRWIEALSGLVEARRGTCPGDEAQV